MPKLAPHVGLNGSTARENERETNDHSSLTEDEHFEERVKERERERERERGRERESILAKEKDKDIEHSMRARILFANVMSGRQVLKYSEEDDLHHFMLLSRKKRRGKFANPERRNSDHRTVIARFEG